MEALRVMVTVNEVTNSYQLILGHNRSTAGLLFCLRD